MGKLDNPPVWGLLMLFAGGAVWYLQPRPGFLPRLPEYGYAVALMGALLILGTALALRVAAHVPGAGLRLDAALQALWRAAGDWSEARRMLQAVLTEDAHVRWLQGLASAARKRLLAALEADDRAAVWEDYTVTRHYQDQEGRWHQRQERRERRVFALHVAVDTSRNLVAIQPYYPHGFRARSREAWRRLISQHAAAILSLLPEATVVQDSIPTGGYGGAGAEHDVLMLRFAPPEPAPAEPEPVALPEPDPEPEAPAADIETPIVPGAPPVALLAPIKRGQGRPTEGRTVAERLSRALERLRRPVEVVGTVVGPGTVTVTLRPGEVVAEQRDGTVRREPVHATQIIAAERELAVALGVEGLRIYADTAAPGCVAVEVPRSSRDGVSLREAVADDAFRRAAREYALPIALGRDARGRVVVADLAAAPHILGAGTTGSGKSVAINALICSLLMSRTPEQVRLFVLDPKQVDFTGYEGLPHLAAPILTEADQGIAVLEWLVQEMERRYGLLRAHGVNNLAKLPPAQALPRLIFVADEFADLLMAAEGDGGKEGKEARAALERNIARIAQKARAAGIHLMLATQRPSADIVTGIIKSNIPSRLALRVNDVRNSQIILDQPGAEALAGKGDALWSPGGAAPIRVQTPFADPDIPTIVGWWREHWTQPIAPLWGPGQEASGAHAVGGEDEGGEDEDIILVDDEEEGIAL